MLKSAYIDNVPIGFIFNIPSDNLPGFLPEAYYKPTTEISGWTIGRNVDLIGYGQGAFGALVPNQWASSVTATIAQLTMNTANNLFELRSSDSSQWDTQLSVSIDIEGWGLTVLDWNTNKYDVTDAALNAYLLFNEGGTLQVQITGGIPAASPWIDSEEWQDNSVWID